MKLGASVPARKEASVHDERDMSPSGRIVYVHGASDRSKGVEEHTRRIKESLERRGTDFEVVAANWGDDVGPTLHDVLLATPGSGDRRGPTRAATEETGIGRLVQGAAAGIVALQYVNVRAPRRLRVWATDVLLRRRDALMQEILGVADVLVYQRAGQKIRDHVKRLLVRKPGDDRPLIALGNSLGGIILVDLLREPDAPKPDLLVTVGSQSSVLQTFGALGDDTSPPFEPWLNIYDRRDFVGFVAQPVWPNVPGILDQRVDLDLGFPEVHGPAYFSEPAVFDAIFSHPALLDWLARISTSSARQDDSGSE